MSNFLDVPSSTGPSKLATMMAGTSLSSAAAAAAPAPGSSAPKKMIVVVDDDSDSDCDDEGLPPPILGEDGSLAEIAKAEGSGAPASTAEAVAKEVEAAQEEGPSMMEQMMQEAAEAKKAEDAKRVKEERKKAKKGFGGALKGGFFNKPAKSKKKKAPAAAPEKKVEKKVEKKKEEEEVFELNADGEMIPTITKRDEKKLGGIHDEVQSAMSGEASGLLREEKKWNNDTLMERIQKSPRLRMGLANPKFTQAIEDMRKDPVAAQKKYKGDKAVEDFITEFAGVMGEHFNEVGAKEEKENAKKMPQQQQQQAAAPMGPDIGPLAKEALKREEARKKNGGSGGVGWEEPAQEKVDEIVGNAELSAILMDPEMQAVLQKCGAPGAMHHFMRDAKWGPKIELLIKHGLIKVER